MCVYTYAYYRFRLFIVNKEFKHREYNVKISDLINVCKLYSKEDTFFIMFCLLVD